MAILTALLGAYGRKGGMFLPTKVAQGRIALPSMPEPDEARADRESGSFPLATEESQGLPHGLIRSTLNGTPYPIKAWIVCGQNILESIPQRQVTLQALAKLDFLCVVDVMPMEQANYADLVLPEATYLERYDPPAIVTTTKRPFVSIRQPAVEPMYESKPGWWIAKELAHRMGLAEYFPWKDPQDHLERLIKPLNVNQTELMSLGAVSLEGRPYIEDRTAADGPLFPTQTGKIELYSSVLDELKFDPLPKFEAVESPPAGYFRLIYGRAPMHSFARSENNEWLNDLMGENAVWLNSKVAMQLRLFDGQKVILENRDGIASPAVTLRVTEGLRADCVYTVHGFGSRSRSLKKAYQRGFSDTALMSQVGIDPLVGTTGMRVNFVRVRPAEV
jgi:thiosulfate reductase/polysulfide reductase chain A